MDLILAEESYSELMRSVPHILFELTWEFITGVLVYPVAKWLFGRWRDREHARIDAEHGISPEMHEHPAQFLRREALTDEEVEIALTALSGMRPIILTGPEFTTIEFVHADVQVGDEVVVRYTNVGATDPKTGREHPIVTFAGVVDEVREGERPIHVTPKPPISTGWWHRYQVQVVRRPAQENEVSR